SHTVQSPDQRLKVPDTGSFVLAVRWSSGDSCYTSAVRGFIHNAITMQMGNDCNGHWIIRCQRTDGENIDVGATAVNLRNSTLNAHGSGANAVSLAIPDTGWYSVHLTFNGESDCWFDTLIHFDPMPAIQSINVERIMCENTAFTFAADATGIGLTYQWDFGDGSWNFGNGIDHVYGEMGNLTLTLIVKDINGCTKTNSQSVIISDNHIENYQIVQTNTPLCPLDSVVIQTVQGDNGYWWSPCHQFSDFYAYVYASGTYIVDIYSNTSGCRKQLELNVPYPNGPLASILCDSTYCQGGVAELIGGIGDSYTYQWHVRSPNNIDSATTANFYCRLVDTGFHQVVLQVSDTAGCSSYDTAWFYVHPTPPAPSLRFCGNPCITDGPVTLCSSNGLELFWSNGTRGASTHYFTDGLAGAYRIDMATGCKSSVATIQIPEAPSFDGVLTGCYCLDDDAIPSDIPLYSLGVSSTLPWEWTRFASPVMNGIIPPAPAVLPLPEVGEYNLVIPDYGLGCHTVSPSLVIENWGCKNSRTPYNTPSVWCAVTKKVCELTGCKLQYEITVRVCNRLEDPVCIDNIHSILPVAYSVTSGIPLVLNPGECQDV
ncbi:MAG: PKD domain-containing protein, partial [Bacteroidales bacterium]|nr:PKD domain-containing protein [Bacteroidales bacterium]